MHWKDLDVWKKSHELVLKVYEISKRFPKNETYAITDQIRRAATSIPANIVEGQSRNTTKEYLQFFIMLGDLWKKFDISFYCQKILVILTILSSNRLKGIAKHSVKS